MTSQSINIWHRCGTCGTMFQSVRELSAHVVIGHSGENLSSEGETSYPAALPAGGTPLHALRTQHTKQSIML